MPVTKVSAFNPSKYFEFTIVQGDQKKKIKLQDIDAEKDSSIKEIVQDAIKHLDKSRGKQVTLIIGDNDTYILKHRKVTELHKKGEDIHPLNHFLHRHVDDQPSSKPNNVLNRFFHVLAVPFHQISSLWNQISGNEKRELNLDIAILQEINHAPLPNSPLSRTQSLKYMIKSLKKERNETKENDPLIARLESTLQYSQKVDKLRKQFAGKSDMKQNGDFKKLVKSYKDEIKALADKPEGSKILLPVGYAQDGSDEEMLLEVFYNEGAYTLHLITQSDKEKPFLTLGLENGILATASHRFTIHKVSEEALFSKISSLIEHQVNPQLKTTSITRFNTTPQKSFHELFQFDGPAQWKATHYDKQLPATTQQGQLRNVISYLHEERNTPVNPKNDLALRLDAFIKVTETSDRWLKNHAYREIVLNTTYTLIDLVEQNREEIFGDNIDEQNQKVDLILKKLEATRIKIENQLPKESKISKVKLSPIKTTAFDVTPTKEIPAVVKTGLTSIPFKSLKSDIVILDPDHLQTSLEASLKRFKQLSTRKNSEPQLEAEIGMFVRTLTHHSDKITALDQAEFDKAAQTFSDIVEIYNAHIERRRFHPIYKWALSRSFKHEEACNTIGLLIISAKIAESRNSRTTETLDENTLHAPKRALTLAHWYIQNLKDENQRQPVDFMKYNLMGPHIQNTLNFYESLTEDKEPLLTITDNSNLYLNIIYGGDPRFIRKATDYARYPRTTDSQLALALSTLKQAVVHQNIMVQGTKKQKELVAKTIKSEFPKKLNLMHRVIKTIEASKGKTSNHYPTAPAGFSLKNNYDDYSDDDLAYIEDVSIFIDTMYRHPAIERKPIGREIINLRRPRNYIYRSNFVTNIFSHADHHDKVYKPPIILDMYQQKFGTKENLSPAYWAANPENFFIAGLLINGKDIHQDVLAAMIVDENYDNTQVTRAENILLSFAKRPELFQNPKLREALEHYLLYSPTEKLKFLNEYLRPKDIKALPNIRSNLAAFAQEDDFDIFIQGILPLFKKEIVTNEEANRHTSASYIIHFVETLRDHVPEEKKSLFDDFFTVEGSLLTGMDLQLSLLNDVTLYQPNDHLKTKNTIATSLLEKAYKDIYLSSNPKESLTDDFLIKVTCALSHYESSGGSYEYDDPYSNERITRLKTLIYDSLLKKPELEQPLVKATLTSLFPEFDASHHTWKVSRQGFPLFESITGSPKYLFDISQGLLSSGGANSEIMPNVLRQDPVVSLLFSDVLRSPWGKATPSEPIPFAKLIAYTHPTNPNYRVLIKHPLDSSNNYSGKPPKIRVERLSQDGTWMVYHRYDSQNDVNALDLPSALKPIIGNKQCWINRTGTKIEVTDGDKLFATIHLTRTNKLAKVTSVERADGRKMLLNDTAISERIGRVTLPEDIIVFGKKNRANYIELPKLKLQSRGTPISYTVKNNQLMSDNIKGYRLAPLGQKAPASALPVSFQSYHLLENEGSKKVLIPFAKLQFVAQEGSTFRTENKAIRNEAYTLTETTPSIEVQEVFEFTLNPETQKLEIFKPEGDAYLYLSYICYVNKDYQLAQHYLSKSHSDAATLKSSENIISMIQEKPDRSTSGKAFLLKVALMQENLVRKEQQKRNLAGLPKLIDKPLVRANNIGKLYSDYYRAKKSVTSPLDQGYYLTSAEKILAMDVISLSRNAEPSLEVSATKEVILPQIEETNRVQLLPISSDMFWFLAANNTSYSKGRLHQPEWMNSQFYKMAQDIIRLDKNSPEYRELAATIKSTLDRIKSKGPDEIEATISHFDHDGPDEDDPVSERIYLPDAIKWIMKRENIDTVLNLRSNAIGPSSYTFLANLLEEKEAGNLEAFGQMPPFNGSGNLISRGYKMMKLMLFSKLLNLNYDPFTDSSNLDPYSKSDLLQYCKEAERLTSHIDKEHPENNIIVNQETMIQRIFFAKSIRRLQKEINDFPETEISAEDLQKMLRKIFFGDKVTNYLEKLDQLKEAIINPLVIEDADSSLGEDDSESSSSEESISERAGLLEKDTADTGVHEALTAKLKKHQSENPVHFKDIQTIDPQVFRDVEKLDTKISEKPLETLSKPITTSDSAKVDLIPSRAKPWTDDFTKKAPKEATLDERVLNNKTSPVQFLVNEHKEGLKAYRKNLDERIYQISESKVSSQLKELSHIEEELLQKKVQSRAKIDELSQKFNTPIALTKLKRETKQSTIPDIDDLLRLWMQDEINVDANNKLLKKLGVHLSEQELKEYDEAICLYMATVTELGQLKRIQQAASDYIGSIGLFKSNGNPHLARKYHDLLTAQRHYALPHDGIAGDPDYRKLLYMEFRLNFCLRENQLATFREMLADPNAVRQLDMGGGKTSVILPLLAEFKANGSNLVTLVLPDALYESNKRDIESRNRELFSKPFFCFEFNRNSDTSIETLSLLYKDMLSTMNNQGFVLTKKGYALNFLNTFKEREHLLAQSLLELGDDEPSDKLQIQLEEFRWMCKIGHLMKTRGQAIGDEIDLVSDVRQEVNFALGQKEKIDDLKLDLGKSLITICLNSDQPHLKKLGDALATNSQATLSPKEREQALRALAKAQIKLWDLTPLGEYDRKALIEYLTVKDCEKVPIDLDKLKNSSNEGEVILYQNLTSLRAFITVGFATSLTRSCDVNFGRDPQSNTFTIPYKASNTPSVSSEFDEEIERITYTLLDYAYKGFNANQIAEYIEATRQLAISQRNNDQESYPTLKHTPAAKEFVKFIHSIDPDNTLMLNTNLLYYDSEDKYQNLVDHINKKNDVKINLCRSLVMTQMTSLNSQIKSNSEDLASIFGCYGGFTGTPWNRYTYADKMHPELNEGVDGKTWQRLLSRPISVVVAPHNPDDPIGMILNGTKFVGKYQVLVDTGAYLKGKHNREFIDAVLAKAKQDKIPIENGVYYNEANQIVCLQQGEKTPVSLGSAPVTDLKKRVNLYDQPHCTGADLPNDKQAKAIVTIGEDTFIRDLFQAVWRLRGLNEEQDVTFFMSDKVRDLVMEGKSGDPTVHDILEYALKVQGIREAEDNWRAEKEKVSGTPGRMMTSILMELGARDQLDASLFRTTIKTFGTHVVQTRKKEEMYDTYAAIPAKLEVNKAYKQAQHSARKTITALHDELVKSPEDVSEVVKVMIDTQDAIKDRKLKHVERITPQVSVAASQTGTEVHVEKETRIETEILTEVQTEILTEVATAQIFRKNKPLPEKYVKYTPELITNFVTSVDKPYTSKVFHPLSERIAHFDQNLYYTQNHQNFHNEYFMDNKKTPLNEAGDQEMFYPDILLHYRKPVRKLFAVKAGDAPMKMVVATDHEIIRYLKPYLNGKEGEDITMAIVSVTPSGPLVLKKVGEGDVDLLPFKGESRNTFMRLYAQAKFYDGQTHYTKEEKVALKAWLEETDIEETRKIFEERFIIGRDPRNEYSKSVLRRLFHDIAKIQDTDPPAEVAKIELLD